MNAQTPDTVEMNDTPKMAAIKAVLSMVSSDHWDTDFIDQIAQDTADDAGADVTEIREEISKVTQQVFEQVREMFIRQLVTEKLIQCHEMSHEVGGVRQTFNSPAEQRIAGLMVKASLAKCAVAGITHPNLTQYWLTNEGYNILTSKTLNHPE